MSESAPKQDAQHPIPLGKYVSALKGMTYMNQNIVKGQVGVIVGYDQSPDKYIVRWSERLQFGVYIYEGNVSASDAKVEVFKGLRPEPGQLPLFDDPGNEGKDRTYLE